MRDIDNEAVTAAVLAKVWGVTSRRVLQLRQAGTLTADASGKFRLGDATRADVATRAPARRGGTARIRSGREGLIRTRRRLAELELAEREGSLGSVAEMRKAGSALATALLARLNVIPSRVAAQHGISD